MSTNGKDKVRITVEIDGEKPIVIELRTCNLRYSIDYEISKITSETGALVGLRPTGKTNVLVKATEYGDKETSKCLSYSVLS